MMKRTFFILLFFISSCGYQPIYLNKSLKSFEFKKIILNGDNYINKKIINIVSIKENNEAENKNELFVSSSSEIKEIYKDSKGQVELYKNIVTVNLKVKNIRGKTIQSKNFVKEFTYNNKQNKFDLSEYQSSIKDELISKIISDIIIYFNSE
jgi:hypothetical protein